MVCPARALFALMMMRVLKPGCCSLTYTIPITNDVMMMYQLNRNKLSQLTETEWRVLSDYEGNELRDGWDGSWYWLFYFFLFNGILHLASVHGKTSCGIVLQYRG